MMSFNSQKQIQLLTFAPQNCSRESLSNYFQVSEHVMNQENY